MDRKVQFEKLRAAELPHGTMVNGAIEAPLDDNGNKILELAVLLGGYELVPLLHRPHKLVAEIAITFLRREEPGHIITGGDLDNRLKTLFDALRMPQTLDELGAPPEGDGERTYCLLEDDSMITGFSIKTHELLEPARDGERNNDVDLTIHVTVVPTFPSFANLGF